MATPSTAYKTCFDGAMLSQKITNQWGYLVSYIREYYPDTTSDVGSATLAVDADMASFRVNYPYAFKLTSSDQERNSFALSLSVVVTRLITNVATLKEALPAETNATDTGEAANMRYSIDAMTTSLTALQTTLPVPCP